MQRNYLIIQTNGNTKTGYGHFYRCLAIAERIKDKVNCIFLTDDYNELLHITITNKFDYVEIIKRNTSNRYDQLTELHKKARSILIDDYSISQPEITYLKKIGFRTIYIDDLLYDFHDIDCLINHNQKHSLLDYNGNAKNYFIGFDYLLLRKQFLAEIPRSFQQKKDIEIFIAAGGTDYYSVSQSIIEKALLNQNIKTINVLTKSPIESFVENPRVIFHSNLNSKNLISLIKKCSVAITTASTLALECSCIGINLILFTIADNQKELNTFLVENELAISIGDWKTSKENLTHYIERSILCDNQIALNQKKYFNRFDFNKLESIFS